MSKTYRPPDSMRCTFTSRDGRRCRMLRSTNEEPAYCVHHLRQWLKQNDIEPPRPRSIYTPGAFDNPWAVRRSLKQVVRELADGRLAPAQAKQLVRLGRLLLISTRRQPRRRRLAHAAPQ